MYVVMEHRFNIGIQERKKQCCFIRNVKREGTAGGGHTTGNRPVLTSGE
jgi:hypothetical protein